MFRGVLDSRGCRYFAMGEILQVVKDIKIVIKVFKVGNLYKLIGSMVKVELGDSGWRWLMRICIFTNERIVGGGAYYRGSDHVFPKPELSCLGLEDAGSLGEVGICPR